MTTLLAVIKDLWNFCFNSTHPSPFTPEVIADSEEKYLKDNSNNYNPPQPEDRTSLPKAAQQMITTALPNKEALSPYGERAYVSVPQANVFLRPVWSYDGVILKLKYSDPVQILGYEGRFARVSVFDKFGFILKDELTVNKEDIFPQLKSGEIYSANHPDTKKLRRIINDEFFAAEMFLPMQCVEYVYYRLLRNGQKISWPDIRPREAGNWQNILKGRLGVQIGVLPKTGALIEFNKPDGSGFIGYTKSVHVDESIVIEGVGRLIEGEYTEEPVSKEQWQEWRPIWIAVS